MLVIDIFYGVMELSTPTEIPSTLENQAQELLESQFLVKKAGT